MWESGIKRITSVLPLNLCNSQRALQGVIGKYIGELAQKHFLASMPTATYAEQARKRALQQRQALASESRVART